MIKLTLFISCFMVASAFALPQGSDKVIKNLVLSNAQFSNVLNQYMGSGDVFSSKYDSLVVRAVAVTQEMHTLCGPLSKSANAVEVTLRKGSENVARAYFAGTGNLKLCKTVQ